VLRLVPLTTQLTGLRKESTVDADFWSVGKVGRDQQINRPCFRLKTFDDAFVAEKSKDRLEINDRCEPSDKRRNRDNDSLHVLRCQRFTIDALDKEWGNSLSSALPSHPTKAG